MDETAPISDKNAELFDALVELSHVLALEDGEVKELQLKAVAGPEWTYRVYFRGVKDYEGGILSV
jgi:hypothetical protein